MHRRKRHAPRLSSEEVVESILERLVTELIAKDLDRRPEELTPLFLHNWRETRLYPHAIPTLMTKLGGYQGMGRRVLTGIEITQQRERAEQFLGQFSSTR